jgi:hypothetical protein
MVETKAANKTLPVLRSPAPGGTEGGEPTSARHLSSAFATGVTGTLKKVLLVAAFCCLFAPSAFAMRIRVEPDHDWTVQVAGGTYGLQGYGRGTDLCWGRTYRYVRVPLYGIVTIGAIGFLGLSFVGYTCLVGGLRHKEDVA